MPNTQAVSWCTVFTMLQNNTQQLSDLPCLWTILQNAENFWSHYLFRGSVINALRRTHDVTTHKIRNKVLFPKPQFTAWKSCEKYVFSNVLEKFDSKIFWPRSNTVHRLPVNVLYMHGTFSQTLLILVPSPVLNAQSTKLIILDFLNVFKLLLWYVRYLMIRTFAIFCVFVCYRILFLKATVRACLILVCLVQRPCLCF